MKAEKKLFRHEQKYLISYKEKEVLLRRFLPVIQRDRNGGKEGYTIRSLYFDDMVNSAYEEKMAGTYARKKYRIRIYDFSDKVIKLECKEKQGSHIHKSAAGLTREEFQWILEERYEFLLHRKEPICKEFYLECTTKRMRPMVIVDYERDAFVVEAGDVRITFDSHVRSGFMTYDIFDSKIPTYEVLEPGMLIMEVKFTQFLPEYVRRLVVPKESQQIAASKYTMCAEKKWELMGY